MEMDPIIAKQTYHGKSWKKTSFFQHLTKVVRALRENSSSFSFFGSLGFFEFLLATPTSAPSSRPGRAQFPFISLVKTSWDGRTFAIWIKEPGTHDTQVFCMVYFKIPT